MLACGSITVTVVCRYGSIAFLYNFVDELTPLFAAAPPAIGGVGLLASQLAVPLVFCGVVLMIYAVCLSVCLFPCNSMLRTGEAALFV